MVGPVSEVRTRRPPNPVPNPMRHRTDSAQQPAADQKAKFDQTLADAKGSNTKPVKHDDRPTRQDLEKTQGGELEYGVRLNDNLHDVGKRFGRSQAELKAANPKLFKPYGNPALIHPGQKITILNDDRTKIAVEMANTKNPEKLKELVTEDMTYATRGLTTPADQLKAVEDGLIERRPRDAAFAELVHKQGETLKQAWDVQGRSHAVWNRLKVAADKSDWQGVKTEIGNQIATLAVTTPTVDAVNAHKTTLLTYGQNVPGLDNQHFVDAVNDSFQTFLVDDPQMAAKQVADAYKNGRPQDATAILRKLTDPKETNPLTAALRLKQSEPTIDLITGGFKASTTIKNLLTGEAKPSGNKIELPDDRIPDLSEGVQQQMFKDLSAAADSAARSPEARATIQHIGAGLKDAPVYYNAPYDHVSKSVSEGNGAVLPLEMLRQLNVAGDRNAASRVSQALLTGIEDLKKTVRNNVNKLGKHAAPLLNPIMNWSPFLENTNGLSIHSPDQKTWIDSHPGIMDTLKSDMERLNVDGYHVQRVLSALGEYAPQLHGMDNQKALLDEAQPPDLEKDPALALTLGASSAGLQDALRQFNLEGLAKGELADLSKIVPDVSWPARMLRNHAQADIKWLTGASSFNAGLSLYGTGTYLWGAVNHGTELRNKIAADGWEKGLLQDNGWRNLGFLGMYAGGTVIEGGQALAQIFTSRLGLNPTDSGWRGMWARAAVQPSAKNYANLPLWGKSFVNHLRIFGWWNALGTANYAMEGNWPKAGALGAATTGTFISTYPGFARLLGLSEATGPVAGTLLVLGGSAAIYGINRYEKAKMAARTEPFNKDYLTRAGVRPEIADALADNDRDGISPASRLYALAKYRNIEPAKLLDWLNKQDAKFVQHLVTDALHPLKADDHGDYVQRTGKDEWDATTMTYNGEVRVYPLPYLEATPPREVREGIYPGETPPLSPKIRDQASVLQPLSLQGLVDWIEKAWDHPLPTQ